MQSYGKPQDEAEVEIFGRAEHASSEIGDRLPHKMYGDSCIGVLQKEGKHCKENTLERSFLPRFLLNIVSSPARRSRTFLRAGYPRSAGLHPRSDALSRLLGRTAKSAAEVTMGVERQRPEPESLERRRNWSICVNNSTYFGTI
jgi:hypothetical protein